MGLWVLDLELKCQYSSIASESWQMAQSRGLPLSRESSQVVHRFLRRTVGERRALPAFWRLGSDEVRLNGFNQLF